MSTLDPALYRKAADVIRTSGLYKGAYEHHGQHCTVGALREASGVGLTNWSPQAQFLGHLLGLPPLGCDCGGPCKNAMDITRWNDGPGTTAEDVIGLLTEAAEKLEAEQGVTV